MLSHLQKKINLACDDLPALPPLDPWQRPGWPGHPQCSPARISEKSIWLEIGAEFWKYKSAQPKKRMGQHLFTSRCFNRETFSRKDSYIFRFWNALLRTIFLNVHRSIAHRDPLVWAWGGRWMLEIEEQEFSTMMMMMMMMVMMMMMMKRKL